MNHSIEKFSDEQKVFLRTLQSWYLTQSDEMHGIKVSWLHGMLKKEHYDETQKAMLNKMVFKYNTYLKNKQN